jgi:Rieske Fe-S protein
MKRRAFLEAALAALGVVGLAACGMTDATAPEIKAFTLKLTDYPSLASVGAIVMLEQGGEPIAISRLSQTSFVALSLVCPHRGTTVSIVSGAFYCTGHGASFSVNGTWTGGQPTSSLARYSLTYDETAGTLQIG